ncbi:MAG TPA: hypothetical protein VFB54_05285 [Burkholderiales bacterium]|nr:hypothetical protein [Burkholderiales bacterium]
MASSQIILVDALILPLRQWRDTPSLAVEFASFWVAAVQRVRRPTGFTYVGTNSTITQITFDITSRP